MKVLREKVIELCVVLGYKAAGQWKKPKMLQKLVEIAGVSDIGDSDVEDEELQALLKVIIEAKGDVEVVQTLDAEEVAPAAEKEEAKTEEAEAPAADAPKSEKPAKKDKAPKEPKPAKEKKTRASGGDWYTVGFGVVRDLDKPVSEEKFIGLVAKAHGNDSTPPADYIVDRLIKAGVVFGKIKVEGGNLVPVV
jgi:hypothetical protein